VHYLCEHLLVRNMIVFLDKLRKLIENEITGVDTENENYGYFISLKKNTLDIFKYIFRI